MAIMKIPFLTNFLVDCSLFYQISFAFKQTLIANIHKMPLYPCISNAIDDTSSGMRIYPEALHVKSFRTLWHGWLRNLLSEKLSRTAKCFSAIKKILELLAKDPKYRWRDRG
jgi:hypothetical protein